MKLRLFMCVGFLCAGLYGCNTRYTIFPPSDHYILRYQNPVSMCAEIKGTANTPPEGSSPAEITYSQITINTRPYWSTAQSESQDLVDEATFEALAKRFNDTDFAGTTERCMTLPMMYVQTESLNIVSDNDYDAAHPAGTSLNDLFLVKYVCVDDILKPPYNFKGTDEQNESGFPAWMFKDEVSAFNLRKPTLIQFNFTFYPKVQPDQNGIHRFTITYTNIEGKMLNATTGALNLAGRQS